MEPERYQEKADQLASAETAMDISELVSVTEERTAELERASPEKLANVRLSDPDAEPGTLSISDLLLLGAPPTLRFCST